MKQRAGNIAGGWFSEHGPKAQELIKSERERQDSKWVGSKNPSPERALVILGEEYGELCEATLEGNEPEALTEAVQTAAVAVAIVESHLRRIAEARG